MGLLALLLTLRLINSGGAAETASRHLLLHVKLPPVDSSIWL